MKIPARWFFAGLLVSLASRAAGTAFDVTSFGRFSGEVAADTAIIQRALDGCASAGGGTVTVPGGLHVTVGSISLRSHVALQLERGAVLLASPRPEDFTLTIPYPVTTHPGEKAPPVGVMIYGDGVEDTAITGAGTIDGNSPAYVAAPGKEIDRAKQQRPYTVVFRACRRATLGT